MKPWLASEEEGTAAGDRTNCCAVAGATGDCKGTTLSPDEALKASYPVVLSLALSLSQSQCGVWPVLRPCLLELLLPRQGGSGSHSGTYRNWLCACGFALLFTIKVGWLAFLQVQGTANGAHTVLRLKHFLEVEWCSPTPLCSHSAEGRSQTWVHFKIPTNVHFKQSHVLSPFRNLSFLCTLTFYGKNHCILG